MATKTIISEQSGPTLPGATTPLFIKTETVYNLDSNGYPDPTKPVINKLLYTPDGSTFFVAAESTEGGRAGSWVAKKYTPAEIFNAGITQYAQSDGSILGPTALQSLNTQNGIVYKAAQNSIKQAATKAGIPPEKQKPLSATLKNTATPTAPRPPAAEEFSRNLKALPNPEIEGTESTDFKDEIMKYPFVIVESKQDYLRITAIEYKARQIGSTNGGGFDYTKLSQGFSPRNEKIKRGTCYLPIQPVILDQNVVNWGPENMDAFSALFAQASYNLAASNLNKQDLRKGFEDFAGALGALGGDANVQNALRLYLAGEAVGNQSFFTRITGAIINPNLELLFNGPTLRTFNYSFRLSPRNTKEAKSVRTIIRFFKEMSAVRTANNALFLKSPNVFELEYFKGSNGRLHPSLNKIKTCALTSMTVNYTPDNSYMTFVDEYSTMTSYDMALTFQELEPVYDKDYKDYKDLSEIGF